MADFTITASNVVPSALTLKLEGTAGATIAAGQAIIEVNGEIVLADASAAATANVLGIAVNSAADGQPIKWIAFGDLVIGSGFTVGTRMFLSATAGALCPYADLVTGDSIVYVGTVKTATTLSVNIHNVGALVP